MNDEASSIHGNIRASSIYTSESGEWKLGGLEILSAVKEDDGIIFSHGSLVPDIGRYSPPEVAKNGWDSIRKNPTHAVDSYQYGILVSEVFNGSFSGSEQVGTTKDVPLNMQTTYKRLTHAMPKMRLSVGHFFEQGSRSGGFFDTPLIQLADGIENLGLKSEAEKDAFLSELERVAESDDFPEDFFKVKVLPELLKSVEFGGGGPKSFSLVMRIASKLAEDEYDSQITPVIVRLFTSPDRALRVCLLGNLPLMIDHLSQRIVTDKIFPQMVTGFGDLAPVVREQTVKAVLVIVPKLSDRVVNGELLRHLAKTANDDQPGIRTNTTICLGKMAKNLGPASRSKVLSAAFARALRDPFVHARNAALMSLAATADVFTEEDCAIKMLPAICPSLVDKEKMIRDQANKTLNIYLERVRKYGQTLPESMLPPPSDGSNPGTRISTPQPGPGGGQWVGWAISSFTNKIATASGEIQPNANGTKPTPFERTASDPSANGVPPRPTTHAAPSAPVVPRVLSSVASREADAEDFGAGWGDIDDAADTADPWGDPVPTASRSSMTSQVSRPSTTSSATYDDGGEPDFEGWLNAQAAAKQQSKRPLPKGLATKKTTVPASKSGGAAPAKKPSPLSGTSRPITSKPVAAPKDDEEGDGWGDAWD
ncbi:Nuclear aminoacylation-dependent tRNA export pathway component [Recurvomyces mirabilis]|uniref:Nuclear aminoacylation-dependent tRNA export pathway component n=1 Tax=Recurvomyces mirabilis TaxID=574656 RepID=UPI002DDDBE1D|nr:Nuclear aminoacylation-dependent tRNA export pathway component [Recurvomyces mirabilis]